MMRICVIGNSHVGAVKMAWDEIETDHPETSLTFFAGRSNSTKGLKPKGGMLVPNTDVLTDQIAYTSGGHREIDPEKYDVFLLYGMLSHPNIPKRYKRVSQAFLQDFLVEKASSSLMVAQARKMRKITNKPVFASMAPVHRLGNDKPPKLMPLHRDVVALLQENTFKKFNCTLVAQPDETLADRRTTLSEFSIGSTRLKTVAETGDQRHAEEDQAHMNAAYGKIWLESFLNRMKHAAAA